jgi:ABC-2 type transport system ATP-binding protein
MPVAIVTSNLSKHYHTRKGDHTAVDHLSLHVDEGEIYAFLGLNGAGKTTTIRMLLGMIRPSEGSASIFGRRVSTRERDLWRAVGYLVETPYAYPELSVRENLDVSRRLHQLDDPHAVGRVIEQLALGEYANRRAGTLSLGNAQRLGLAKALLHRPRLLILDEPANGLDPAGVVEVRELLRALVQQQGVTIFMSSHILGEVARLATRIGIIHHGRLVEELEMAEMERSCHKWLVVDARDRRAARAALTQAGFSVMEGEEGVFKLDAERAIEHPDDIAQLLVRAGAPPTRLSVEQDDLETHFLKIVGMKAGVS